VSLGIAPAPPGIDSLLETVVVFLVFAVPILRSIFGAKKEQAGRKPRPQPPRRAEPRGETGLDTWERLLRGEIEVEQEPAPPPRPAPARPPPEVRSTRKRAKQPAPPRPPPANQPLSKPLGEAFAQELGPQMSTVSEDELEAHGEDVSAPEPLAALAERVAAEDLARSQIASPGESEAAAAAPEPAHALVGGPIDWRRAVVLSEVLGTPLALRRERADSLPGFQ
jgi:hypothetical protein